MEVTITTEYCLVNDTMWQVGVLYQHVILVEQWIVWNHTMCLCLYEPAVKRSRSRSSWSIEWRGEVLALHMHLMITEWWHDIIQSTIYNGSPIYISTEEHLIPLFSFYFIYQTVPVITSHTMWEVVNTIEWVGIICNNYLSIYVMPMDLWNEVKPLSTTSGSLVCYLLCREKYSYSFTIPTID